MERITQIPAHRLSLKYLFWIPSVYFILHTLEELPNFAAWVGRHFGTYSTELFVTIHIPLLLLVFWASYKASASQRHTGWVIVATAAQIQFGVNALFHITTSVLFAEYSPGVLVAAALGLPSTYYLLKRVRNEKLLTRRQLILATNIGITFAAVAIATLFLH